MALEKELNAKYGANKLKFHKCDVTTDELQKAFDATIKKFGYIDILVNNAGIMNDHPTIYEKEIAINVVSDHHYNNINLITYIFFHTRG